MGMRVYQSGFAGGEISPEMLGRIGDGRYQLGAARLRNMIARPQGPARRRPGTKYVAAVKNGATQPMRLIPFIYNNEQAVTVGLGYNSGSIGLGIGYARFYVDGGVLGPESFTPWNSGTAYVIGSCMSSGSVNYYCILPHTNVAAPNPIYWYPMPEGILEIPTPYHADDLFALRHDQSGDILTITHENYFPSELRRESAGRWTLKTASIGSVVQAPTNVVATAGKQPSTGVILVTHMSATPPSTFSTSVNHNLADGDGVYLRGTIGWPGTAPNPSPLDKWWQVQVDPTTPRTRFRLIDPETGLFWTNNHSLTGNVTLVDVWLEAADLYSERTNSYVVTAIDSTTQDESVASAADDVANNLRAIGAYNTITWTAVSGADRYRIYREVSGLYGLVGETEDTTWRDDNVVPDLGISPPILDESFDGTDNPAACGHFDQRRLFAATDSKPRGVWATRTGTENDLTYSLPSRDDDRLYFVVTSKGSIRHLVSMHSLVMLTSDTELVASPVGSEALVPGGINVRTQSYVGCNTVKPLIVNNSLLFAAARGGHVREMGFNSDHGGYLTGDVSLRAAHLFDDYEIVDSTLQKAPDPIAWFVSSNGRLLGFTYVPEEGIGAWHWHDTDGTFESVCAIPEGGEDRIYVVVKRTINGNTVRYVERMGLMSVSALEDAFYVDCGGTYDNVSVTSVSGATWLEGERVQVLGNGTVRAETTVSAGVVAFGGAASTAQFGLPYVSELQTLPLIMQVDGHGQGRQKNVSRVWARVYESGDFKVGPSSDLTVSARLPSGSLTSALVEVRPNGSWQADGQVWIRQTAPLPLTVVGLTIEVATGG